LTREYQSGTELQKSILTGVNLLTDNVASTLGPRGRNVILHQKGKNPIVTKDGVTVSNFIETENSFENAGVQILKQAASQTNNAAGDGTTTTTVLARAIVEHSQKYLAAGASPIELKRGIDKATFKVVKALEEISRPVMSEEDIAHIATISANGDKTIGKLIATAVDLAGKDGAITIEEARSSETTLDVVEGFRFDSGYLANAFITDERDGSVTYEDPLFLITDAKVETVEELMPVLEIVARENRPLVIVAESVEGQALAALIMNTTRGTLRVAAVKAPRYGQERRGILKDLALSVGATFMSRESGVKLSEAKLTDFGSSKKTKILKNFTTIVDGRGDYEEIEKKIEALKVELGQTDSLYECEKIQERITRLASGIAIIRVGAATEVEMIEKKHRIEDALSAVKSAQEEGIVTGGGTALLRAVKGLTVETDTEEQSFGVEVVKLAVREPLRQMAMNAGESPDLIVKLVEEQEDAAGYNFVTRKIVNLYDAGIIDPTKVTRCALENASSAASTLITTNYCVIAS